MTGGRLRSLLHKELLDLARNRAALLPVALVAIMALALPFAITIGIPAATGEHLSDDRDLLRISQALAGGPDLSADARVQAFLFEQFLLVFLLIPITGAMALAAHAVVGEKLARTLEPLLATPLTTAEILIAKVIGALIPTLLMSLAGLGIFVACIAAFAEPGVLGALINIRSAALVALVGPGAALVALQSAVIVSSRVNDPRTAQQFGVLIILPLTGLLVAQFTGAVWLSAQTLALAGVALFGLWAVLAAVSVALFDREAILTKWR